MEYRIKLKKEIMAELDILVRRCQGTSLMIVAVVDDDEEAFYFGADEYREPIEATMQKAKFQRQPKYALNS